MKSIPGSTSSTFRFIGLGVVPARKGCDGDGAHELIFLIRKRNQQGAWNWNVFILWVLVILKEWREGKTWGESSTCTGHKILAGNSVVLVCYCRATISGWMLMVSDWFDAAASKQTEEPNIACFDRRNLPTEVVAPVVGGNEATTLHEAVKSVVVSRCIHQRRNRVNFRTPLVIVGCVKGKNY